jgi:hypothetical protein
VGNASASLTMSTAFRFTVRSYRVSVSREPIASRRQTRSNVRTLPPLMPPLATKAKGRRGEHRLGSSGPPYSCSVLYSTGRDGNVSVRVGDCGDVLCDQRLHHGQAGGALCRPCRSRRGCQQR